MSPNEAGGKVSDSEIAANNLAAQWARSRGFVIELPSGKKFRMIRSLDLMAALKAGVIPNPLRETLSKMIEEKQPIMPAEKRQDPRVMTQMDTLVEETVCKASIDPRVFRVPEGQDPQTWYPDEPNSISIVDLSPDDRLFIYTVAQGGATDVEGFRRQQEELMAALANGRKVQLPTKRTTRTSKK